MTAQDRPTRSERLRPWGALFLPPLSWMAYEWGLGSSLRASCAAVGNWLGLAWGALSLGLCVAAAMLAWPQARGGGATNPPVRPWLSRIALLIAGVFALAIAFQCLATQIVPACAR